MNRLTDDDLLRIYGDITPHPVFVPALRAVAEAAVGHAQNSLVEAVKTAIRVLDSDPGPMTREAVANGLRAILAVSEQPK